jgi:hypothetical protein
MRRRRFFSSTLCFRKNQGIWRARWSHHVSHGFFFFFATINKEMWEYSQEMCKSKKHHNLRSNDSVVVRAEATLFFRRSFLGRWPIGFGGAEIFDFIPLPFVPWRNIGRRRAHWFRSLRVSLFFGRSRGFVRSCDFTLRTRGFLRIVGNNDLLIYLSTFR